MDVYEELREHLDKHPTGAPKAPEILEILSILFSPEEAKVAAAMPFLPMTAERIAERVGVPAGDAKSRLESLADKGLVYAREKGGEWGYALLPVMPGIFEFPFMKGKKDKTLERLAVLWDDYLQQVARVSPEDIPIARVIPIQDDIENEPQVLTYEKVYQLIDEAEVLGLAHCACRTAFANCDAPLEACMLFDDTCRYLVDRGFARYISKEEMKQKLKEFDEMGLVHNVNNSQDKLQFICNCCPCCCGFLRSIIELKIPNFLATSGFLASVDEELCNGCAVCEERCPLDAIEVIDEVARVDTDRCIGCGICVSGCDTDAVELARREDMPETPETMREFGIKTLQNKGKLEEFIEINK